jgi:hypothetical protein
MAALLLTWIAGRMVDAAPELRLLATFLFVASWAPALASFIRRDRAVPALMALIVGVGTPLVLLRVMPALRDRLGASTVASAMNQVSARNARLLVLEPPPASLRLRLERPIAVPRRLAPALRDLRDERGWAYIAYTPRRESEVARAASPWPLEVLARTPGLVLARVGRR